MSRKMRSLDGTDDATLLGRLLADGKLDEMKKCAPGQEATVLAGVKVAAEAEEVLHPSIGKNGLRERLSVLLWLRANRDFREVIADTDPFETTNVDTENFGLPPEEIKEAAAKEVLLVDEQVVYENIGLSWDERELATPGNVVSKDVDDTETTKGSSVL
ncbi:unnamed protein product [Phytophthora lilii]|uniref:Unnamed protein product n=1 Tax=Phytophthora lilii TaxID=2077276 RepID=A0A9W6XIP9_9STRA|nr:unnamed protein product [Phytophthora lilii]